MDLQAPDEVCGEGFALDVVRLPRGQQNVWQGTFTRIGQRLEVLAMSKDD